MRVKERPIPGWSENNAKNLRLFNGEREGLSLKWCFEYDTNLGKVRDRDSCGYNVLADKIER